MDETRDRLEPFRRIARRVPGAMTVGRVLHEWLDPGLRSVALTRRAHPDTLFQPFPTTAADRYPELFDALAQRLSGLPQPRVLSFGCASGDEVRALRNRMPHARITGIDANARAIAQARKADPDPLSDYRNASIISPGERFDAILALAVFRHGALEAEQPESCSAILPFSRFAQGVAMLDACLEAGGWLAIANAHFRFADLPLAPRYNPAATRIATAPQTLLYGPDDRRIEGTSYDDVLFAKAGLPAGD